MANSSQIWLASIPQQCPKCFLCGHLLLCKALETSNDREKVADEAYRLQQPFYWETLPQHHRGSGSDSDCCRHGPPGSLGLAQALKQSNAQEQCQDLLQNRCDDLLQGILVDAVPQCLTSSSLEQGAIPEMPNSVRAKCCTPFTDERQHRSSVLTGRTLLELSSLPETHCWSDCGVITSLQR